MIDILFGFLFSLVVPFFCCFALEEDEHDVYGCHVMFVACLGAAANGVFLIPLWFVATEQEIQVFIASYLGFFISCIIGQLIWNQQRKEL